MWNGLKNKGRKTLCVSRAGHGRAHVTIIDMLTLQFTTPAACPCAGHRALKKHLACSRHSQSHLGGDAGLLTHDIRDFGKEGGHYNCHSAKSDIPEGMRSKF